MEGKDKNSHKFLNNNSKFVGIFTMVDAVRCTCPYHTEFYYIIPQRYKITLGFLPQQTHPKRTHTMNKTTELCVANRHPINTTKRYNRKTTKLCQQINISNDWMQRSFSSLSLIIKLQWTPEGCARIEWIQFQKISK